ncbi:MAG: type II toxin-antitoxin system RelE/ParE family toxin [Bacteroidetes bacterium]|nr:type II toxin-antitoxin system RelE/ParE family toxin [Bacteroidota bacterium]
MKIIITKSALARLEQINEYFEQKASRKVAQKIVSSILNTIESLKVHTNLGQKEETLEQLNKGHRYLVQGNYKVVYRQEDLCIYVTDIFDTRQDPIKIKG